MTTQIPESQFSGAIPTLNGRGFMLEALASFAEEFVASAAANDGEALDMGCAYGVATLAALNAGARVCACDMEQLHLDVLADKTPDALKPNLRMVAGSLPDVSFPPGAFQTILASRVIHFLSGDDVKKTLAAMYTWLEPGGRLFLVADTPYMPGWSEIVPAYEKAKAGGAPWPGFIPDFERFSSSAKSATGGPKFMNTLDPDILERECRAAGFDVDRASYFGLQRLGDESNGREHCGCAARKPV